MTVERVLLAEPRGFCAGVEMAIKALTWMTRIFDGPVYCFHEIVHNEWVVRAFERVGVVFVDDIAEVPEGAPIMLSAHGTAPEVFENGDPVLHNGKAALFDTYLKSVSHGDDRGWHYEETVEPQSQARIRFGDAEVPVGKDVSVVPIEELRFDAPEHP